MFLFSFIQKPDFQLKYYTKVGLFWEYFKRPVPQGFSGLNKNLKLLHFIKR